MMLIYVEKLISLLAMIKVFSRVYCQHIVHMISWNRAIALAIAIAIAIAIAVFCEKFELCLCGEACSYISS